MRGRTPRAHHGEKKSWNTTPLPHGVGWRRSGGDRSSTAAAPNSTRPPSPTSTLSATQIGGRPPTCAGCAQHEYLASASRECADQRPRHAMVPRGRDCPGHRTGAPGEPDRPEGRGCRGPRFRLTSPGRRRTCERSAHATRADDLDAVGALDGPFGFDEAVADWDLDVFRATVYDRPPCPMVPGTTWIVESGETVTAAPELARLTLNLARTHTDPQAAAHGRRLVYGGHTIGIAAAHVTRALPDLVYIVAWHECRHLAPVFEGDVLRSVIQLERLDPRANGGALVHVRVVVTADRDSGTDEVLDWRFVGVVP